MERTVSMVAGIDSNFGLPGRYEYVIMQETVAGSDDWEILARATGYRSKKAAQTAGLKAYQQRLA